MGFDPNYFSKIYRVDLTQKTKTKMTPKPKGRPPKKKRNISGLRNQPKISTVDNPLSPIFESAEQEVNGDCDDITGNHRLPHDIKDLASSEQEDDGDLDSDFESDDEWKGLTSIDLGKRLAALSCKIDDDDEDQDWIPYKLRRRKGKRKGKKQYYNKSLYVTSFTCRSSQNLC